MGQNLRTLHWRQDLAELVWNVVPPYRAQQTVNTRGAMLPAVIIVVAALLHTSAITEAATLRSSDGVDYAVDNDRVIDHCTLLRHVLTDTADGGPIPLPAIPSTHLKVLVEFMKQTAANDQVWP